MSTTTALRLPYDQWLASQSKEQLAEHYKNKLKKKKSGVKGGKRVANKRSYVTKGTRGARSVKLQGGSGSTFYGYGDYTNRDPMSKIDPRTEYAFAPDYGSRLGSAVGEGIQSFAHALGFGEYNIQQNSCMSHRYLDMGTSPPRVMNTNRGEATVFSHREYLGELVTGLNTPSDFTLQSFTINPGNSILFPFGSRLAENFQEWEIRGMLVELKSEASETSTTLNLGSMFAAVDYNSLDPAPTNKTELENLEYACSNKPSKSILMPVECARKNDVLTHLYVAVDEDYQGGDIRLYDIGKLYVGSFGCPAASAPIAEIWVTYEIAFFKPHLHQVVAPIVELPTYGVHYKGSYAGDAGTATFVASTLAPGSDPIAEVSAPDVFRVFHRDTQRSYILNMSWRSAAALTSALPTLSFSAGLVPIVNFYSSQAVNNGQTYNYASYAAAADTWSMSFAFTVAAGLPINFDTITFVWPTGAPKNATSTLVNWDLTLSRIPLALVSLPAPMFHFDSQFDRSQIDAYIDRELQKRMKGITFTPSV